MQVTQAGTILTQIINAQTIASGVSFPINFDTSQMKTAQLFIVIDKTYDMTFYPMMDNSTNNIPAGGLQTLASNVAAPAAGRSNAYALTALPAPIGRILITNKDATLSATVSVWIASRSN